MVKRIFCLLLAGILLAGCSPVTGSTNGSGGPSATKGPGGGGGTQLVAPPLDTTQISYEGMDAQDMYCYLDGRLESDGRDKEDGFIRWEYDGHLSDASAVESYVDLLCRKFDFTLACDPYISREGKYHILEFEYVLRYTGGRHRSDLVVEGYHQDQSGDIVISGYCSRSNGGDDPEMVFRVGYPNWMKVMDKGYRYGSEGMYDSYVGESFGAGLNRLKDGSYQTTDGRLTAALGEAMFLTDGQGKTHPARMEWNQKKKWKQLCVDDKFGVQQMVFRLGLTDQVSTGDIFTVLEMDSTLYNAYSSVPNDDPLFAILHEEKYRVPTTGLHSTMSRFNARVMYWNEEEEVAVLYFCACFRSGPEQIEGLVAVPMGGSTGSGDAASGEYVVAKGNSLEITGPSQFDAGYNLWTWELLEGSGLAELQDTASRTCTLIARKAGTVKIRVTYEYSVKVPDVLTGNETYSQRTKTEEYVIVITD